MPQMLFPFHLLLLYIGSSPTANIHNILTINIIITTYKINPLSKLPLHIFLTKYRSNTKQYILLTSQTKRALLFPFYILQIANFLPTEILP